MYQKLAKKRDSHSKFVHVYISLISKRPMTKEFLLHVVDFCKKETYTLRERSLQILKTHQKETSTNTNFVSLLSYIGLFEIKETYTDTNFVSVSSICNTSFV